jgi:cytochrome c biogenesis protein CcdA
MFNAYPLALAAGLLAAINPCGFALLPAYLSLLVVGDGEGGRRAAVRRALASTAAMTAGFVTVFGGFGLLVVPLALSVERYLPWATVVIGVLLLGVGGWLLAGRELTVVAPKMRAGKPRASLGWAVLYGVSYAVASLSCTIGPFLAVATSAFRSSGVLVGLGAFVVYAFGMGLVVGVVALAVALARGGVALKMRRLLPVVSRVSGALLVVAGAYVTYYGWYEIRLFAGSVAGRDPVIDAAITIQGALTRWIDGTSPGWFLLAAAVLLTIGVAVPRRGAAGRRRRRESRNPSR